MEKVQKVCKGIKQFAIPDEYGNLAYVISFTDNTEGFFRCKEQNLFTIGQESAFYFGKQIGKSGKEYYKIERVEKHEKDFEKKTSPGGTSTGTYGRSESDIQQINRSVAIKAVCELRTQSNVSVESLLKEADQIFDYIQFGVTDQAQPEEIEENDLPF